MTARLHLAAIAALAAAGCGGDDNAVPLEDCATPTECLAHDECNPLGGTNCMTPWPSAIYQIEDAASPTGFRNAVPLGAWPSNRGGVFVDPEPVFNQRTGVNPASPILTAFETGVDGSNLVYHDDFPASVTAASPTVLIDAATGELVEHFAELDSRAADTPASQALFIRPARLLDFGTRYIVAIKKTLKAPGGGDLPIPPGFQAILDGGGGHPLLDRVRDRYPDIFASLEAHGIAQGELVVAWDFVTADKADVQRDLIAARDRALEAIGDGSSLDFAVESDEPDSDPLIARRIEGTFTSPLLLSQDGRSTTETRIVRDAGGLPMVVGTYQARFTAIVPECALTAEEPVPMMIYGHGLLGSHEQAASGGVKALVGRQCMVAYGTDFRGFSELDLQNVALTLNDLNTGDRFFPVQIQGLIDHIALTRVAQGPMAETLFVGDKGEGPVTLVDPAQVHYYGISQGGIMGGLVMAYEPAIARGVLQVGAINYSLLLERSRDWPTYRDIMIGAYADPLDVALLLNIMQEQWDTDPANIASDLLTGGIPGTPPKQILMQIAVADDEVANAASEYQARSMEMETLGPSVYEPYGVPEAAGPLSSGLAIYDFDLGDSIPRGNQAPPDNEVHGRLRFHQAAIDQIGTFLFTGEIQSFCSGEAGCECEEGACGGDVRE
jgi:hypothetical protein